MSDETILVVDDNAQAANFVAGELLPGLGYQAVAAYTGRAALEIIRAHQPDLVLLDFQLSDTTGLEMLRQLASEGYNVPTIFVTAHGSEEIAVDAFRLGVHDYLIKPVDVDTLNTAIARALAETRLLRERDSLTAQLKQQVTWLTVLSKIGRSVTSTLELDEVLRRIVEAGVYLTQAEEGFLAMLDDQSAQLYLRAAKNLDKNKSETLHLWVNDSLLGKVVSTGRAVRMAQTPQGPPLEMSTGFLVLSLLHVPILARGSALGVLSVDNRLNGREFSDMDEMLLTSLADYASVALENARLYQQAQREIVERKQAEEHLRASLKEKEVLLKEIHHRVKNNLQVVSSLLSLQAHKVQEPASLEMLRESQNRIRSMALLHEKLYQSQGPALVDLGEYVRSLAADLFSSYQVNPKAIALEVNTFQDIRLGTDAAILCGLVITELVSNALKHAFPPGRAGEIWIDLCQGEDGRVGLSVSDDGIGIPDDFDLSCPKSLGLQLVVTLVSQLAGHIELDRNDRTTFKVTFAEPYPQRAVLGV